MPQFAPGITKTARAPITVSPPGLSCLAQLYLVKNSSEVATAPIQSFTSIGSRQDISFPITMPSAEGTYPVWIDVAAEGMLICLYKSKVGQEVQIVAPVPTSDIKDFNLRTEGGTYDRGDTVVFEGSYEYKGKAQGGWLTISLGTGIYPSFSTKHTFSRVRVSFDESMEWAPGYVSGSFKLPTTLTLGQTYSVRAKLETDDGKQETDTDWGVFDIAVPGVAKFAYVSDIRCSGSPDRYRAEVDVKNTGNAAGVCSLDLYFRIFIPPAPKIGWSGWTSWIGECSSWAAGNLYPTTMQPGQIKTFFGEFDFYAGATKLEVYFTGSPGKSSLKEVTL